MYLLLSIAFKKLNNICKAIKTLCQVLEDHPSYYDAYVYRGKMYIKEKKWEKARVDFIHAINIHPERGIGYLGQADCLRFTNRHEEAIDVYSRAIEAETDILTNILLKRAITYVDIGSLEKALVDLECVKTLPVGIIG